MVNVVPSFVAVIALAIIHAIAGKLRFLEGAPRSRWLSIAMHCTFLSRITACANTISATTSASDGGSW